MSKRLLATTALVLSLALPAAAGAAQSTSVQQSTKVEQSTSASASTRLLNDAKAQLRSAMTALEQVKDATGEKFAEAREKARVAIEEVETALARAKAEIAESSREAIVATRKKIAEARDLIDNQESRPQEIASSLGSVDDAVGGVKVGAAAGASGSAETKMTDGKAGMDAKAGAQADAKSDTGVLGTVGSTVDSTVKAGTDTAAGVAGEGWQKVELVGKTVHGADQEAVGEIDDVVMAESGKVESVLVDVGGFLGIGAKQVAIPVANLEVQGETLVAAGLTKKQAEAMPEYKRQQ
ncbi:MAG: PRC-barrel domain-containing protein [Thalassobaculum sp.]|uniref:PRC-barrel domain-containing protein n=1 Tax=Thalassobaculum sp. TaxID=2022740 RepID=UPI0032EEC5DD